MLATIIVLFSLVFTVAYFGRQCLQIEKIEESFSEVGDTKINDLESPLPTRISTENFLWTIYWGKSGGSGFLHAIRKIGYATEFILWPFGACLKRHLERDNPFRGKQTLVPLPSISLFKLLNLVRKHGSGKKLCCAIGKQYPVVELPFWKLRIVFLNNLQIGKRVFTSAEFCGKPKNEMTDFLTQGMHGIGFNFGQSWKEQRRFCHQHLKHFGFGTKAMEALIHKEIEDLIQNWCHWNGKSFSPNRDFDIPVINSLWVLLAGERVSALEQNRNQKEPLVKLVGSVFKDFNQALGFAEVLLFVCNLKLANLNRVINWIPIFPGLKSIQRSFLRLRSHFKDLVYARRKTLDWNANASNLMDAYLIQGFRTKDPESPFYGDEGEKHLLQVMTDLFLAGGDTTSNMLSWAMLHLIRNQDIQEKIRIEIDNVVDRNNLPSLNDRCNCPFTEAFLLEVLRFRSVAALSLPHTTTEDAKIGPYFVKKGTIVFLNICHILHDKNIWGDPHNFRPERFLNENGTKLIQNEALCSFSVGQRRCIGDQVAKDNLFLFVSAICQRFILKPDPNSKYFGLQSDRSYGMCTPKMYYMVLEDRFENK